MLLATTITFIKISMLVSIEITDDIFYEIEIVDIYRYPVPCLQGLHASILSISQMIQNLFSFSKS